MYLGLHIFDHVCIENGIEHRLTKPYHPWTNDQAERMNRTIKETTIRAFHYPDLHALKAHLLAFVSAYNFAKHLKALKWKTLFDALNAHGRATQKSSKLTCITSSRDQTARLSGQTVSTP